MWFWAERRKRRNSYLLRQLWGLLETWATCPEALLLDCLAGQRSGSQVGRRTWHVCLGICSRAPPGQFSASQWANTTLLLWKSCSQNAKCPTYSNQLFLFRLYIMGHFRGQICSSRPWWWDSGELRNWPGEHRSDWLYIEHESAKDYVYGIWIFRYSK